MHYLTVSEYKRWSGLSRPTIYKRARGGMLDSLTTEDGTIIIKVEDTEYAKVKGK